MNRMDEVRIIKNKQLRGQIMRTMSLFYPDRVMVTNLKSSLMVRGLNDVSETYNHLHYLKDKGYIRVSEGLSKELKDDDLVEMTSRGVDLIEGTIDDPGVML